ncbi:MAG: DNA primase [Thaumarchaeota archaeon]|jgi:DNA primase|nr:DNA primase [Candidatus Wolframiiraptor allenii]
MKYLIEARIEVNGVVDKNDVVGAVFGQTEGLFSSEFDLRELQKSGRIGRIEITVNVQDKRTIGRIMVPTALDKYSTALIAAMIESIERVGPYTASVKIERIHDLRAEKRRKIVERARAILYEWEKSKIPEEDEILKELEESLLRAKMIELGPERIPAGPDAEKSDELIIVEGRADVINLLRHGYTNVVAVEGVKIPEYVKSLAGRKRRVIAFLDGDRGGDMILYQLHSSGVKIDEVARAPYGKEVEGLTGKEISDALHRAVPLEEALKGLKMPKAVERERVELPEGIKRYVEEVKERLMAILLDEGLNELKRVPVSELAQELENYKDSAKYVVFDGIVTQRLVDILSGRPDEVYLIGVRMGDISKPADNVKIMTFNQL